MTHSAPRRRHAVARAVAPFLAALVAALATACAGDAPAAASTGPSASVDRVLLVSVDGLRGDALRHMPQLWALAQGGRWTDSARTIVPSRTLPAHLAMLTGRDVSAFGITSNALDDQTALSLALKGATSVFAWLTSAGSRSAAVVGASLVPEARRDVARQFLGVDSLVVTALDASRVADAAVPLLLGEAPAARRRLVFVHFSDVDLAGHDSGWTDAQGLGAAYLAAALRVDSAIARLYAAVASDVDARRALMIVTADHGGGAGTGCVAGVDASHEHCTGAPADVTIPLVMLGDGGQGRFAGTPRLTQIARTVAARLGVAAPSAADGVIAR